MFIRIDMKYDDNVKNEGPLIYLGSCPFMNGYVPKNVPLH